MTVSNHTALYRISFPPPPGTPVPPKTNGTASTYTTTTTNKSSPTGPSPLILIDLTDLSDSRGSGSVSVDPDTGRITGSGTFSPSFGVGTYDLHFCADFDGQGVAVRDTGVFQNNRPGPPGLPGGPRSLTTRSTGATGPVPAGAWVRFNPLPPPDGDEDKEEHVLQVLVRVGLSYVSSDQACSNAEGEVPGAGGFDFDRVRGDAEDAWLARLGVVSVDPAGVNGLFLTTFWSGMYRSLISPQDLTGENPLWKSPEPCKCCGCAQVARGSSEREGERERQADTNMQIMTRSIVSGTLTGASILSSPWSIPSARP